MKQKMLITTFLLMLTLITTSQGQGKLSGTADLDNFRGVEKRLAGNNVNIKDHGAVGDDATDNSTAFLKAINEATGPGKSHRVLVPEGIYKISAPVLRDFSSRNDIVFEGMGSGSIIRLATGDTTAFDFANAYSILFRDLTFAGAPTGGTPDVGIGLHFKNIIKVTFENVNFYGVYAPGSLIKAEQSHLLINNSKFRGCTAHSATGIPLIWSQNWRGLVVTHSHFIDYGDLNGVYYSKTPVDPAYAWILVNKPAEEIVGTVQPVGNAYAQGTVIIEGNVFDEGAQISVVITSNPPIGDPWTARVRIAHNNSNVSGMSTGGGYHIQNVRNLVYEQNYTGWLLVDGTGLSLQSVTDAHVKGSFFEQGANRIHVSGPTRLKLENSYFKDLVLASDTLVEVIQRGKHSIKTRNAGTYLYGQLTPASAFEADDLAVSGLIVGGGTVLTKVAAYAPTLTPTTVPANTTEEQTYAVTGLAITDRLVVNQPSSTPGVGIVGVRVSAADTLKITWGNFTAGAVTPASGVYLIIALR